MRYPYILEQDGDGFLIRFYDVPEAISYAYSLEEAKSMAADALIQALSFYFETGKPVPLPSKQNEAPGIELPTSTWLKILLLNEVLNSPLSQAEIARKMGKKSQELTRIVNLNHKTKLDTLVLALNALGKEIEFRLTERTP